MLTVSFGKPALWPPAHSGKRTRVASRPSESRTTRRRQVRFSECRHPPRRRQAAISRRNFPEPYRRRIWHEACCILCDDLVRMAKRYDVASHPDLKSGPHSIQGSCEPARGRGRHDTMVSMPDTSGPGVSGSTRDPIVPCCYAPRCGALCRHANDELLDPEFFVRWTASCVSAAATSSTSLSLRCC